MDNDIKTGLSSIAHPALGASGFPIDSCTNIILSALKAFPEVHNQSRIKKVSLVDPTDHVDAFHKRFGEPLARI